MQTILAIDWGSKRTGAALGNTVAKIASPYMQLATNSNLIGELQRITVSEEIDRVLVGLPRNLSGEETAQSAEIRRFATELSQAIQCPVLLQDETLSTDAGAELKPRFPGADKDSLAAAVILQDYLNAL